MRSSGKRGGGISRRQLLRAGSGFAAGASLFGLAACTDRPSSSGADKAMFEIPDPTVKLPSGDVTFRLMDSNDTKGPFWEQFFAAYEKKHPNITTKYDGLPWNRIEEVAPLGFRNNTAHDVLQLPGSIPATQAVAEGWVTALDDILPDVDAFKANFPEGTFAEGVNMFDGKIYLVPLASDQRHQVLVHYNKKLMDQAGFDPASEPFTYDSFREAAKKITKQGKGRAYGVVLEIGQPGRLEFMVRYMARSAGAATENPLGNIDLRTGEFFFDRDEVAEAIELLLALKSDKSVFPGSNSLVAPEAWPRVVRGNAGMVMAGPWVTVLWENDNSGFDFGVAAHPVATNDPVPPGYPLFGTDGVFVSEGSKVKPVAADVLSYVTSPNGQQAWGTIVGVGNPPINEDARNAIKDGVSPQAKRCLELAEAMVADPSPAVRNPDTAIVAREQKPVSPNFGEVIQAAYVGEIDDLRKALKDLKARSDRALDDAIAAAKKKGAKVSREDYVFGNWDPRKDYTEADYDAL